MTNQEIIKELKVEFICEYEKQRIAKNKAVDIISAINDLRLTEIYVNLKNHDFESCGNYKMDEKEAEKFIEVYKLLRGIDEDDAN